MARTTYVKKRTVGKKGPRDLRCATCGKNIEYGTPYKWFKRKSSYGGTVFAYHNDCTIRPSHRTTSKMGTIYDAQADFDPGDSIEEIRSNLEAFAQTVRDVGQEYQDSADNIEQGFQHATSQSEELADKAQQLDSWADEIEATDLDENEPTEDDVEQPPDEPELTEDQIAEKLAEKVEEWLEEQRDAARSAVDECPV